MPAAQPHDSCLNENVNSVLAYSRSLNDGEFGIAMIL